MHEDTHSNEISELYAEVLGTKSDKVSYKVFAKLLPIYNHCVIVLNSTLEVISREFGRDRRGLQSYVDKDI